MKTLESNIVKHKDWGNEGELGRICSIEAVGCWVYFQTAGCLFVHMDSLEEAVGDAPLCPRDCPPKNGGLELNSEMLACPKKEEIDKMARKRPSVFIGSSSEGLKIAKNLQVLLDRSCEVTIWSQGVFGLSQGTLESLVLALDDFDFAVLVLTPDDMVTSREATGSVPRDNVLFELGLFMGGLGRNRTFILYDRSEDLKLPSDLAGVTPATFEPHSSGNLKSALGAASTEIENCIDDLGLRDKERLKQLSKATSDFDSVNKQMYTLIKLLSQSRKVELDIIASQFGGVINTDKLKQMRKNLDQFEKVLNDEDENGI